MTLRTATAFASSDAALRSTTPSSPAAAETNGRVATEHSVVASRVAATESSRRVSSPNASHTRACSLAPPGSSRGSASDAAAASAASRLPRPSSASSPGMGNFHADGARRIETSLAAHDWSASSSFVPAPARDAASSASAMTRRA